MSCGFWGYGWKWALIGIVIGFNIAVVIIGVWDIKWPKHLMKSGMTDL